MKIVLFKDHVLINGKLFYYKESVNNVVCDLCYFTSESCCKKYREYIGLTDYSMAPYCYALGIERHNRGKISNRIPMITILRPFPYKLSLFIYKLIIKEESKFKIYEI